MGQKRGIDAVYCLNAQTGVEIWKADYPPTRCSYPGPRSATVLGNMLILNACRNGLVLSETTPAGHEEPLRRIASIRHAALSQEFRKPELSHL
jgi:hypothetical protein